MRLTAALVHCKPIGNCYSELHCAHCVYNVPYYLGYQGLCEHYNQQVYQFSLYSLMLRHCVSKSMRQLRIALLSRYLRCRNVYHQAVQDASMVHCCTHGPLLHCPDNPRGQPRPPHRSYSFVGARFHKWLSTHRTNPTHSSIGKGRSCTLSIPCTRFDNHPDQSYPLHRFCSFLGSRLHNLGTW